MPYQLGIVKALQRYGLKVDTVPGWTTAGSSSFNPAGVVGHHTAGPKSGDRPSLKVCVNGRPGLSGPLCELFLPRGLTTAQQAPVVVAAGRANHAGSGGFRGLVGNSSVFGIEAEDDGIDGQWTEWQLWAYPRVVAGLLDICKKDHTWYCAHRTWTTRKPDPTGISDTWMREQVKKVMNQPRTLPPVTPKPVEDEMFLARAGSGTAVQYFAIEAGGKRRLAAGAFNQLKAAGVVERTGLGSTTLSEFPTYVEDGTVGGSSYNDLRASGAAAPVTTAIKADTAAIRTQVEGEVQ